MFMEERLMSVLSDKDIFSLIMEKKLVISPLEVTQIQPASVDLRLGGKLQIPCPGTVALYPGAEKPAPGHTDIALSEKPYTLEPGAIAYVSTLETLRIPTGYNARIYNKNSLAQLGLNVWPAYINPGYEGVMPLVLKNDGVHRLVIKAGMRICQMEVSALQTPPSRSYADRHEAPALQQLAQRSGMEGSSSAPRSQLSLFLENRIRELASSD